MNDTAKVKQSPLIEADDTELIERVGRQDETAFESVLRRHEDKVYRLAFRLLHNREEARDVAQEVFIRIWENPHAWRPKHKFTTWLYRVTTNRALNRLRTLKLKSFFSLSSETTPGIEVVQSGDDPAAESIQREQARVFEHEFNNLPARQRAALHLKYIENLSVSDVAKTLGVSFKSAESLIFRGKQRLRERVDLS